MLLFSYNEKGKLSESWGRHIQKPTDSSTTSPSQPSATTNTVTVTDLLNVLPGWTLNCFNHENQNGDQQNSDHVNLEKVETSGDKIFANTISVAKWKNTGDFAEAIKKIGSSDFVVE